MRSSPKYATMADRIYLDHAATTPVRDEVVAAMLPHFGRGFNASSLHAEGRAARTALDRARASVAGALGASPREIVFTGGGSEADALAIFGIARAAGASRRHVVTVATEHHAVLHAMDRLREDGFEVTVLPVDGAGRVALADVAAAVRPDTLLVSVMLANNELGTLAPVAEIARLAHGAGALVHCDAVQAPGRVPIDVRTLDVDVLALSAHKFYGPKGVGALYVRAGTPLAPLVVGGGQEAGLRAGTENVAGIVGFATALELATAEREAEAERLTALRDRLEAGLMRDVPDARVNAAAAARLPNVSSLAFRGVDASALLVRLDLAGVAVSAGSACAAGATEASHVLAAIGAPAWALAGTIRLSLGKLTRAADVERFLTIGPQAISAVRVGNTEVGTEPVGPTNGYLEVFH